MPKYADKLLLVEQAIEDVLTRGQSIRTDGDQWTKADLEGLYKLEERYRKLAAKEAGTGKTRVYSLTP